MSFAQRLQDAAEKVDARLAALLQTARSTHVNSNESANLPGRLLEAVRHATLGGGKRIRPFLVIESAALFGLDRPQAVDAAAAIECIHCYSLVHDDLPAMDNDELRRGRPTVWKAYDEWTAILVGDSLLTFAFEVLASPATHDDPAVRSELVLTLARASGMAGMAGGQALDLEAGKRGVPPHPDLAHILRLQAMKTGALITCACDMGAVLGRADAGQREALVRYGQALGSAFQIADDLLDAEGDVSTAGKAVAKDAAAGKATVVGLMGVAAARDRLRSLEAEAVTALAGFGERASVLADAARFVAGR
ncbi:MAG: polyprenyl synthetase family protein [Hyphomicrobium sp.]